MVSFVGLIENISFHVLSLFGRYTLRVSFDRTRYLLFWVRIQPEASSRSLALCHIPSAILPFRIVIAFRIGAKIAYLGWQQ